jgi:hypothetical protein
MAGVNSSPPIIELGYSVQTGELIGTLKLQQVINLNESGDAWTATLRFTLFDPNGNTLFSGTAQPRPHASRSSRRSSLPK